MLENFTKSVDYGGKCGILLVDFSYAFDYIDHELLIAKFSSMKFHPQLLI